MDINQIESNLEALLSGYAEDNFIYGLLSAYGLANAAITRLKKGDYNLSKTPGEILWKKKVFFKKENNLDLHLAIDQLSKTPAIIKQHPRFIIVTDFKTFLALDTDNADTLDVPIKELVRHYDFFLPWAGMEKTQLQNENPADIKAAERMGRLYDLILEENPIEDDTQRHALNVFFTRLLFCFFAEDTGIFPAGIFVNGIGSHTSEEGSDLQSYLTKLFRVLNTEDRSSCPKFLTEYPYVNGGLFAAESPVPRFNARSRKIMIECAALNWKAINPDIFGSMMQAVVHSDERSGRGMHYTSVVNIMKVIEPLFLNDLREELEKAGDNKQKLEKLLERIYRLRIFDPACGSGNFLIIAYKALCKLEIEIFKRLNPRGQMSFKFQNKLKINQFYGIEIDDFAHETAKLSLWLAEHQMNLAFREVFGNARPTLPLQDGGNIVCGNATRLCWNSICPIGEREIHVLGNPPYLGARYQEGNHKDDIREVLGQISNHNDLDYVACWIKKAADYIRGQPAKFAFVSTNSIVQGTQVAILWPHILASLEIAFAHPSFKWTNNARGNAAVICVVVGVRNIENKSKRIYEGDFAREVKNISPYLTSSATTYVSSRRDSVSGLPSICFGSMANDGGHLLLSSAEKNDLIDSVPAAKKFIRKCVGSKEFINGLDRYCIWINEGEAKQALSISPIATRVEKVRQHRLQSDRAATKLLAEVPYRFGEVRHLEGTSFIVPKVSSERREYIPVGVLHGDTVISDLAFAIYNAHSYVLALLASRMHMVWVRAVAGRLKSDFRYSASLCYNTFPFPGISAELQSALEAKVLQLLDVRETFSERTLADLYDPEIMPRELKCAHVELDELVDSCYRIKQFRNDEERLERLFDLYSHMTLQEKDREVVNA